MRKSETSSFIFRRDQRQGTALSVLALLPLSLLTLSVLLVISTNISLARSYIELIISLPNWAMALIYLAAPVWAIYKSYQLAKYGTLYRLRKYNRIILTGGVLLLFLEFLIVIFQ